MFKTVLPDIHTTLIRPPQPPSTIPRVIQVPIAELIERVTSSTEQMEENIALAAWEEGDDGDRFGGRKTEVRVDGALGVAWTPFEVLVDGVASTCGTNVFSLVKRVGTVGVSEWVICGIADTARPVAG